MRTRQTIGYQQRSVVRGLPTTRTRAARPAATKVMFALVTIAVALVMATSAAASSDQTVSPRDNCGGFNGHVVVSDGSTPTLQLYGEVWDDTCPGWTSVWLAWQSPGSQNIQVQVADEPSTVGVNYTTGPLQLPPADIKVTVCSTYGGWHCGTPVSVIPAARRGPPVPVRVAQARAAPQGPRSRRPTAPVVKRSRVPSSTSPARPPGRSTTYSARLACSAPMTGSAMTAPTSSPGRSRSAVATPRRSSTPAARATITTGTSPRSSSGAGGVTPVCGRRPRRAPEPAAQYLAAVLAPRQARRRDLRRLD